MRLENLAGIRVEVVAEFGRANPTLSSFAGWGEGSIVKLHSLAGEGVDLRVNGIVVAKGEVVVVDENFGVRVTELVTTDAE